MIRADAGGLKVPLFAVPLAGQSAGREVEIGTCEMGICTSPNLRTPGTNGLL
jgi:hypothetical protein